METCAIFAVRKNMPERLHAPKSHAAASKSSLKQSTCKSRLHIEAPDGLLAMNGQYHQLCVRHEIGRDQHVEDP